MIINKTQACNGSSVARTNQKSIFDWDEWIGMNSKWRESFGMFFILSELRPAFLNLRLAGYVELIKTTISLWKLLTFQTCQCLTTTFYPFYLYSLLYSIPIPLTNGFRWHTHFLSYHGLNNWVERDRQLWLILLREALIDRKGGAVHNVRLLFEILAFSPLLLTPGFSFWQTQENIN